MLPQSAKWIASLSLSSGAHSRDPLARNDGAGHFCTKRRHTLRRRDIQYTAAHRFYQVAAKPDASSQRALIQSALKSRKI
jgi:hypothetical protein